MIIEKREKGGYPKLLVVMGEYSPKEKQGGTLLGMATIIIFAILVFIRTE